MSKEYKTPADFGIEAAKLDARHAKEIKFMGDLIDEFKFFVIDSMRDGMHDEFDDHFSFMSYALETFIGLKEDEEV